MKILFKTFLENIPLKNFHENLKQNLFGKHSVEKFPSKTKQTLFGKHSVEKLP
jgi:hypothetical protein